MLPDLKFGNEAPFPAILDCDRAPADVHIVAAGKDGQVEAALTLAGTLSQAGLRPGSGRAGGDVEAADHAT